MSVPNELNFIFTTKNTGVKRKGNAVLELFLY